MRSVLTGEREQAVPFMSDDGETGSGPVLSCFIATTPWAGGLFLSEALRATQRVGDPREYFHPTELLRRANRWGVLTTKGEFGRRYLTEVGEVARGQNGVLAVSLPWSHQRWLTRIARASLPEDPERPPLRDAEVLEAWYPNGRYLYLTRMDKAQQAASWYRKRPFGGALVGGRPSSADEPDFQEIRWIETLIGRQERAWEAYFKVHGIQPHRVSYEALADNPEETVTGVLDWLGLPPMPGRVWLSRIRPQRTVQPAGWLPDYHEQRAQLNQTIGVRQG